MNNSIESIKISNDEDTVIVFPQKNLIGDVSLSLCQIFDDLISSGNLNFKLDFSKVNKIDSIGIGAIVLLNRKTFQKGKVSLEKMNSKIKKFFSLILTEKSNT